MQKTKYHTSNTHIDKNMNEIKLFHFFVKTSSYEWQHMGDLNGYESIEKMKKDTLVNIMITEVEKPSKIPIGRVKWKIMKLVDVEKSWGEKRE